jgi:Flp pilus assembly protein TadD
MRKIRGAMTATLLPSAPALAAFRAGDYAAAAHRAAQALAAHPFDRDLLLLHALSLHQLERRPEALAAFRRLTEVAPEQAENWANLGTLLRETGQADEAEAAYLQAIERDPHNPAHRINLALLLRETGNIAGARLALLDAHDLDPASLEVRVYGSLACFDCGDAPRAERLLEGHEQWRHQLPVDLLLDLGRALLQLGHERESQDVLARAQALAPNDPMVAIWRVLMLERVNRLDEARAAATALPDPSTLADPGLAAEVVGAQAAIAAREREPATARALLEKLAQEAPGNALIQGNVQFALAKVCDALGDTAATMAALRRAHDAQLATAQGLVPEMFAPDAEPLRIAMTRLTTQEAAWPRDDGPAAADSPIFIMGFPRSGTTLLEQMLDAHPDLRSMDERTFIQGAVERMERMGLSHPQQLGELTREQLDTLRAGYWKQVAGAVEIAPGQRLVDKNPLNMLRLPLAARMFPSAPIILALRHPCDVLLSCYMQNFRSPSFMVLCSTLARLARSYVNAMNFWIHHEALLAPRVLHLRYEDLTADVDGHVERLGGFLGLDDPSRLLDFQANARAKGFISTPSYAQVVEPISKKAVGRWKKYEPYFADALPILRPIMEHWGYEA